MTTCPKCQAENFRNAQICIECSTYLKDPGTTPEKLITVRTKSIAESDLNENWSDQHFTDDTSLLNQFLTSSDSQTVLTRGFIEVTAYTVRLGSDVYQFRNVTGFGIGNVKLKTIPFWLIINLSIALFIASLFTTSVFGEGWEGFCILLSILVLAGGIIFNLARPKLYGLSLYLNSGKEIIIVIQNTEFLKRVLRDLKEFMENPQKEKMINITVGGSLGGNITFGDNHGNISNRQ